MPPTDKLSRGGEHPVKKRTTSSSRTSHNRDFPNTEMEMELGGAEGTEDKLTIFHFQLVFVDFLLLNWN